MLTSLKRMEDIKLMNDVYVRVCIWSRRSWRKLHIQAVKLLGRSATLIWNSCTALQANVSSHESVMMVRQMISETLTWTPLSHGWLPKKTVLRAKFSSLAMKLFVFCFYEWEYCDTLWFISSDGTIEEQIPFIRFNSLGIVLSVEIEPSVGKLVAWHTRSLVTKQLSLMSVVRC